MRSNPGIQITRYNIAEISGTAYNKGVSPDNLVGAFRKTGVFPMGKMAIEDVKTAPSAIIYIDETGDHMRDQDIETAKSFFDSRKIVKCLLLQGNGRLLQSWVISVPPQRKNLSLGHLGLQQHSNQLTVYSYTLTQNKTQTQKKPLKVICAVCVRGWTQTLCGLTWV